jgi:hypothetical protein
MGSNRPRWGSLRLPRTALLRVRSAGHLVRSHGRAGRVRATSDGGPRSMGSVLPRARCVPVPGQLHRGVSARPEPVRGAGLADARRGAALRRAAALDFTRVASGRAWVRHAPDEGRGPRDELRFCEAVRPERIDHPPDGLTSPRRAWRLEEDEEPPIVIERPADASQLFRRRRRPEDVDVDGEDLVKPGRARVEVPNIDGLEREPP